MGRILAIDYGKKRVGIAVTDELKLVANPLTTVSSDEIFKFLSDYILKEKVEEFIVGKPYRMNYEESESTVFIEPFVEKLKNKFPQIPVIRVDERFTSKMAFQTMIDAGLKKKDRQNKALIDAISAAIMLQSYLSRIEH